LTQYQDRKVQLKRDILKAGLPLPAPPRPLPEVGGGGGGGGMGNANGTVDLSGGAAPASPALGLGTLRGMGSQSNGAGAGSAAAASASSEQRLMVKSTTGVVYFVGNKLGGGNFGVVHDCKDAFERDFVAKQIRPNRKKEELEAEWAKEVQFLFSLNHPNIVRLFDAFQYDDRYYMIMERCAGSVRDYVKRNGPMDGPRVIDAAGQILSGLNHIHSRDIIHRDLHIDNVLYADSLPGQNVYMKISDFGISKLLKNGQAAAKTFIGRDYDYAPELVTKGHTTTRSDLYQCGLVLFHLYTGRHVLSAKDGDNVVQVITSGLAGQRAKALNTKLGDVLAVLLRREPDYRFSDATEAWQAIYSIVNPPRQQ
jgi:serine/threonine protein kinase